MGLFDLIAGGGASDRTLKFPSGQPIGAVWSRAEGTKGFGGWKQLCDAQGKVEIPEGAEAMLQVRPEISPDLSFLSGFGPDSIHTLDLWDTRAGDSQLAHLAKLKGLRGLNLSRTPITDAGLAHLAGMDQIQNLNLYGTLVGDEGMARLSGLTSLQILWINKTNVTDAGLAHLTGLKSLKEIYVADTAITEAGRTALKKALPACFIRAGKGSIWSY